jgi:group I intron endonuclease
MIGVYKITNTADGKVYIGSTAIDTDHRWSTHRALLRTGKHYNRHLQNAWNKYGESVFTFEVVEEGTTKDDIRQKELSWIAKFFGKNCYNATKKAAGRSSDEESKRLVIEAMSTGRVSPKNIVDYLKDRHGVVLTYSRVHNIIRRDIGTTVTRAVKNIVWDEKFKPIGYKWEKSK